MGTDDLKKRLELANIEVMDDCVAAFLRKKTPTEHIALMLEANKMGRSHIEKKIRSEHPEWEDARVSAELARRWLNLTPEEVREIDRLWDARLHELAERDAQATV